jgi:prepilin-type N-terminal cleavage/methylation domain-containing protein
MNRMEQNNQRGYNLVEVLIATAMLGVVVMSILTLFVMGRRNVYSGKQMTRATSAATHAAEDLSPLTTDEIWTAFGVTTTTTTTSPTIAGTAYTNVIVRSTTSTVAAEDAGGYLARWRALLPASAIRNGRVHVIFTPTDYATTNDPTSARLVRVRIVAEWAEGRRVRSVTIDTVKLNRV